VGSSYAWMPDDRSTDRERDRSEHFAAHRCSLLFDKSLVSLRDSLPMLTIVSRKVRKDVAIIGKW
jgi:hypothetical protein